MAKFNCNLFLGIFSAILLLFYFTACALSFLGPLINIHDATIVTTHGLWYGCIFPKGQADPNNVFTQWPSELCVWFWENTDLMKGQPWWMITTQALQAGSVLMTLPCIPLTLGLLCCCQTSVVARVTGALTVVSSLLLTGAVVVYAAMMKVEQNVSPFVTSGPVLYSWGWYLGLAGAGLGFITGALLLLLAHRGKQDKYKV